MALVERTRVTLKLEKLHEGSEGRTCTWASEKNRRAHPDERQQLGGLHPAENFSAIIRVRFYGILFGRLVGNEKTGFKGYARKAEVCNPETDIGLTQGGLTLGWT